MNVKTIDNGLLLYSDRDVNSSTTHVEALRYVELGIPREIGGREWVEARLTNGTAGFALLPSIRSHTDFRGGAAPIGHQSGLGTRQRGKLEVGPDKLAQLQVVKNSFSEVSSGHFIRKGEFRTLPEIEIIRRLKSFATTHCLTEVTVGAASLSLKNRTEKPPWLTLEVFKVGENKYVIRGWKSWGANYDDDTWDAA